MSRRIFKVKMRRLADQGKKESDQELVLVLVQHLGALKEDYQVTTVDTLRPILQIEIRTTL